MASTRITRTLSANGDKKITISAWIKRSKISDAQYICRVFSDANNQGGLYFTSGDNIEWFDYVGGAYKLRYITNAVFRDTSAWYHILAHYDNSLSTPEAKLYVNGVEQSLSTSTNYTQNQTTSWNNNYTFDIGSASTGTYFDGSMAHFYFIQNQKYAPTIFGETDSTSGIWKPITSPTIDYSATGSNSCFLKFENSGNMDLDSGSNNVSFTTSGNLTQNVDTPSNNFATLNPLMNPYGGNDSSAFSNGNLSFVNATTDYSGLANLGVINGKWYWEVKSVNQTSTRAVGIVRADKISINTTYGFYINDNAAQTDFTASYKGTGLASVKLTGARTTTDTGVTYGTGDIIGIALDLSSVQKTIKYYKNGSIVNTTNLDDSFVDDFVLPAFRIDATQSMDFNFGQGYFGTTAVVSANADANGHGAMEYAVPSGYYTICTKNIKEFG